MHTDINPVTLSLVPIIGTLFLAFVSTFALSRHAAKKATARREVDELKQSILRQDAQIDQDFVDSIVRGLAVDQATAQFQKARRECLPTANPPAPHLWSIEQLEIHCRNALREKIEAVNRAILVPSAAVFAATVAVGTIAVAVLYNFESDSVIPVTPTSTNGIPPLPPPLMNSPLLNSPVPQDAANPPAQPTTPVPTTGRAADTPDDAAPKAFVPPATATT